MMTRLSEYSVEVGKVGREAWHDTVAGFADANIYQTWSYQSVLSGDKNVQHVVVRREGKVVAAAQARITTIPLACTRIAYVRWGPLWRRCGEKGDASVFAAAIAALREEFVVKRRMVLRIVPLLFEDEASLFHPALEQERFVHPSIEVPQRTVLIDLRPSPAELRQGLGQKWRNCLNHAERNGLTVLEGGEDDLFCRFLEIYRETKERKKFLESSSVQQFRAMQHDLPPSFRMRVFLAYHGDLPAAGLIVSGIGDMGVFLFGGTSYAGLSSKGSYLLQWKALNWLKEQGASWYNLAGINPLTNPGTYHFKMGLCGRNGKEVAALGTYDTCGNAVTAKVFHLANAARVMHRRGMLIFNQIRARHA